MIGESPTDVLILMIGQTPKDVLIFYPDTCDRFADSENKRVETFYSRFFTPGTAGVDTGSFNWASENNWLAPPIYLVNKVIKHCLVCKAEGTLIVPKWESAPFCPLLLNNKYVCMRYNIF